MHDRPADKLDQARLQVMSDVLVLVRHLDDVSDLTELTRDDNSYLDHLTQTSTHRADHAGYRFD